MKHTINKVLQNRIEAAAENHEQCYNVGEEHGYLYTHKGDIKEAVIYGATLALQNQWISVEEALPDDDENVLLIFDDGHIIVAYHSGNYWWWCDGFICGTKTNGQPMYSSSQRVIFTPTHWMPIPQLKGGEQ